MMRTLAISAFALVFAFGGLAHNPEGSEHIELVVAGPPIEAAETRHDYIYLTPSVPSGLEGNGSSSGILSQGWSMLGREDKAAAIDDEYNAAPCPAIEPQIGGDANVLSHIKEMARDYRVVIINESHTVTRHRDFSRKVIAALRPLGYSVLAAETFSNRNDGRPDPVEIHAERPYVESELGHYSKEPMFGAMLREAKAQGYRFAAYEQVYVPGREPPKDGRISIRDRETEQAANLAALIATLGPDEKLIVHVGYAHAREANVIGPDGWDHSWMAARLKRDHEIDPLTIAQTICIGSAENVQLAASPPPMEGYFDLLIDHPISEFRYGRPDWRFEGDHEAVSIPDALRPLDGPLIIEAFAEGEPFDAVPVDRVWVEPGEDVRLVLKPGRYTVRAVRPARLPSD